jgi:hypothetical protein
VLQLKDLRGRPVGEKVTERDGKILQELGNRQAGEHDQGARKIRAQIQKALYHIGTVCQELIVSDLDG